MLSFFSQIQLLNLSGLLLGIAAPLLIFAYLKAKNSKSTLVSSTFILEQLSKKPVVTSKVKPPLRFLFELLALLLICLAASAPIWSKNNGKVAILIDNSLSMATHLNATQKKSRLDEAKEIASKYIDSLKSDTLISVFSLAPTVELVGSKDSSKNQAKNSIDKSSIFLSDGSLNSSIEEIVESHDFNSLLVISDFKVKKTTNNEPIKDTEDKKDEESVTNIEYRQVGKTTSNYFISEISLTQPGISKQENKKIKVTAHYSGQGAPNVPIRLYNISLKDNSKRFIQEKNFTFTNEQEEITFELYGKNSPVYKVELGTGKIQAENANLLDDSAWVSEEAQKQTSALLVSQNPTNYQMGLANIPGVEFTNVTPTEYANLEDSKVDDFTFMIFHHSAPTKTPKKSSLLILPPDQNKIFPILEETSSPKITSWSNQHPITSYLKVNLIGTGNSAIIDVPSWATSIINSEDGSLLAAGEKAGVRLIASGMELLPFEGNKTPSISVLTLNLINWLKKDTSLGFEILTGSKHKNVSSKKSVILTPKGDVKKIKAFEAFIFGNPGAYIVPNKDTRKNAKKSELLIVNSFFPSESTTASIQSINIPAKIIKSDIATEGKNQIWKYMIYAGLLFLLIEFFMRLNKNKRLTQ